MISRKNILNKFICERCKETFISNWPEEEAKKEYELSSYYNPKEEICNICDDCFKEFNIERIIMNNEKITKIKEEFEEHGLLCNSLYLIEYGNILIEVINRHDCSLNELLEGIKQSCLAKIEKNDIRFRKKFYYE